ncbi:MAG: DUF2785 domain-containing protein [Halieaceae bacterium]|jgi:hypothetical protein|nr:DUF2785 domain-containing protein [Halieaceae bacterium]
MINLSIFLVAALLTAAPVSAQSACSPLGLTSDLLENAHASGFASIDDESIPEFLKGTPPCLSSIDPFFRDQIGYEGTATLLRRNDVADPQLIAALRALRQDLVNRLEASVADPDGVMKPFAAIVLAEVARTDRVSPWMTAEERRDSVAAAGRYLSEITDYRAFEDGVGFRHGVAHGADLVLQLALNPEIPPDALLPLVDAISVQIAPQSGVAYITGEPDRLARALFYLMQRAENSDPLRQRIIDLVTNLSDSAPYESWASVFRSEKALTFRHNRRAFISALYLRASPHADHELIAPFMDPLGVALNTVP